MRISNSRLVALLVAALLGVAGGDALTTTTTTTTTWEETNVGRPQERRLAEQWCVAKPNLADSAYQGALDWACGQLSGQGQVNCVPIQSGQTCYLPNTFQSHASWAMNAYYQAQGQASQSCDFQSSATLTITNPSSTTCAYASPNGTNASGNNGTSGAMGNHLFHSQPLSYLSAVVSIIAYFTAQAL